MVVDVEQEVRVGARVVKHLLRHWSDKKSKSVLDPCTLMESVPDAPIGELVALVRLESRVHLEQVRQSVASVA